MDGYICRFIFLLKSSSFSIHFGMIACHLLLDYCSININCSTSLLYSAFIFGPCIYGSCNTFLCLGYQSNSLFHENVPVWWPGNSFLYVLQCIS